MCWTTKLRAEIITIKINHKVWITADWVWSWIWLVLCIVNEQGQSEGFSPYELEIWWMILENNTSTLHQALCIFSNPSVNSNWSNSLETLNSGQNWQFFVPCDLEIWWMTLKNNRAPLLCCFKLCASFHSHHWIQTGGTVRKRPIWVKIGDFFVPLWPRNWMADRGKQ